MSKFGRIGVLAGGPSNEREISLNSGRAVFGALVSEGFDAIFLDVREDIYDIINRNKIDAAFIALHGRYGEDGTVQALLEGLHIPYTGSGPEASRLAMDKIASKEVFIRNGIPTPKYFVLEEKTDHLRVTPRRNDYCNPSHLRVTPRRNDYCNPSHLRGVTGLSNHSPEVRYGSKQSNIDLPLVVKPQWEGSSIGLSVVRTNAFLKAAVDKAFKYGSKILLEEYIDGRELTVGILDDTALPVIEIVPRERIYDYTAKYQDPETKYLVPAPIDREHFKTAQEFARLAHLALGCRSVSRVDMMMNEKGDIFVLEVNTIPGMTERSLLPKAARSAGITFGALCSKLVESALKVKYEAAEKK